MPEVLTAHIDNDDQQMTNQINTVNFDHPLSFHFEDDIADRQRKQYESEIMGRKKNSHKYNLHIHKISISFFLEL